MKDQIPTKTELVWTINYDNVFYMDIAIVLGLLLLTLFWKEQRTLMLVGALLYGGFAALWHFPPGLMSY